MGFSGNSKGVGDLKQKTFRGRGTDILWNNTFHQLLSAIFKMRPDPNSNFDGLMTSSLVFI